MIGSAVLGFYMKRSGKLRGLGKSEVRIRKHCANEGTTLEKLGCGMCMFLKQRTRPERPKTRFADSNN